MFTLPAKLVVGLEHFHVYETVNRFSMRQVFRLSPTPPGPTVMKARTMLTPRSVKHIAAGRVVKEGGVEELQHPC